MNQIKPLQHFIEQGIVKKQNPDLSRSEFLRTEVASSFRSLQKRIKIIGFDADSINSIIKDCYDIIMELIRSEMLLEGLHAVGNGAHEAEVAYLREKHFSEEDVQFLNDLRYFRNGIIYYGKILSEDYAKKVFVFIEKMYELLQ
ncbi:MAG: hypothetical protein ACMXYK_01000 [Candidatus Woesearchaeota archaeon]